MEYNLAKMLMKTRSLLIVLALFCCGFTKNGHAQGFGEDLEDLLLEFEKAKKENSIVGYLPTDSIIGYISIHPEYRDNLRPDDVEELENARAYHTRRSRKV